eukprot:gnl/TRDRNA2_/TRDRNA2_148092_c0_seq1.p1 gnl/TRDRNA2_/TRDRNA2_148092_c0~~gnl/TRDRNA2_/TRDRNA2_148092_c0_seq1.p1  ORF type:complete len:126 (+),score=15.40 gnl/TRDRNA2_/TRDRNA2_148092_c0_seq1:140-517(+)
MVDLWGAAQRRVCASVEKGLLRLVRGSDELQMLQTVKAAGLAHEAVVHIVRLRSIEKVNPGDVLATIPYPQSIDDWLSVQDTVFVGHHPLPQGWMRCWSRSRQAEYYVRLEDMFTTFEAADMYAH